MTPMQKVADQLLVAFAAVVDLDQLHALVSNEPLDRLEAPDLTTWLVTLINCERDRRERDDRAADYPVADFVNYPAPQLVKATGAALAIAEAALFLGEPSIQQFARRLEELLFASMSESLLNFWTLFQEAMAT